MKQYLYLEWKRALKLLPTIVLIDLILLVLSGLIGVQLAKNQQGDEAQQKVRMGIVGDIEASPELRLGLYALENFDHSKYVVDLLPMEEEEAKEAIMSGQINAYFIIPEGFVESVGSYADDKPIRYVSTDGAVTIGTQQVDEIVESLASMLTEVQSSIYGMQLIVSGATAFGYCLAIEKFPNQVSKLITGVSSNPNVLMLLMILAMTIIGMFMDTTSAAIIMVPIFFPIAEAAGINGIHFGMVMVLTFVLGGITPPVGVTLYIAVAVAKLKLGQLLKEMWPFILLFVAVMMLVAYVPMVCLFLPNLIGG